MHLISQVLKGKTLSYYRHPRCSKLRWSWCYTNLKTLWTADSEALVWRQGSLCPLNTSTRMQRPQKGSNLYVLQLIIKEVFRARQIQPCKSPYAGSSNWMRGVTSRLTNAECNGLLEEWSKESLTRGTSIPNLHPIHPLLDWSLNVKVYVTGWATCWRFCALKTKESQGGWSSSGQWYVTPDRGRHLVPRRQRASLGRLNYPS